MIRILLLEDDIRTVAALTHYMILLEEEMSSHGMDLSLVVLSEYSMVEDYINPDARHPFDVVLLDRDCKMGGSFHALELMGSATFYDNIQECPDLPEQI